MSRQKASFSPTIRDIVKHLVSVEACLPLRTLPTALASLPIRGISKDTEAETGDLAWISYRYVSSESSRLNSFKGSLLLCPTEALTASEHRAGAVYLACPSPKLAFARAVTQFFNHLTRTQWPAASTRSIDADARIGSNPVFGPGVVIGSNVTIGDEVTIGPNSTIAHSRIGNRVVIGANCSIGLPGFGYEKDASGVYWRFPHVGGIVIEDNVEIGSNTCIDRGGLGDTRIGRGAKIDNLVHIAHNVDMGCNVIVVANSMIAGSTVIRDGVWVAPSASLINQITIGSNAVIGMGAVVLKSVEPSEVMVGNPAKALPRKQ